MGNKTSTVIAVLAMGGETSDNKAKRAADLRKQADAADAKADAAEDERDGDTARGLRAQAARQRDLAALVEPKKSTRGKARSAKSDPS